MRLGIDASRANRRERTGVEQYAYHLIQALKTITPPSVEVVLYSAGPLVGPLADLPVNWQSKVLRWPPRFLWTHGRLSWEMWRHPVDILLIPAHVVPLMHPRQTAMTIHDVAFRFFPEAYSWWENFYQHWAIRFARRHCPLIFTPSKATADDLIHYYSFSASQIIVTPLALPTAVTTGVASLPSGVHSPYILCVGRQERKKNLTAAIAALEALPANYQLVLVGGSGHGATAVQQAIRQSPRAADIIQIGWVDESTLDTLYRSAVSLVFPSLYEGFGLPLLEAMAAGCPVVASNCSSIPEVAATAAVLINPDRPAEIATAVERLEHDDHWRAQMITTGYQRVRHFSWTTTATITWQALAKIAILK